MLCAKCHKNEATIHLTTVVQGEEAETIDLCRDCGPSMGLHISDPKELETLSVMGKRCEFCGGAAFSGLMDASRPIYWCFDCGMEFGRMLTDLCISERPDLMQQGQEESSFLKFCCDPEFQAWSEAANRKAVQMLKERRRQDGRDPSG